MCGERGVCALSCGVPFAPRRRWLLQSSWPCRLCSFVCGFSVGCAVFLMWKVRRCVRVRVCVGLPCRARPPSGAGAGRVRAVVARACGVGGASSRRGVGVDRIAREPVRVTTRESPLRRISYRYGPVRISRKNRTPLERHADARVSRVRSVGARARTSAAIA